MLQQKKGQSNHIKDKTSLPLNYIFRSWDVQNLIFNSANMK